jgi:hypothetical protein
VISGPFSVRSCPGKRYPDAIVSVRSLLLQLPTACDGGRDATDADAAESQGKDREEECLLPLPI